MKQITFILLIGLEVFGYIPSKIDSTDSTRHQLIQHNLGVFENRWSIAFIGSRDELAKVELLDISGKTVKTIFSNAGSTYLDSLASVFTQNEADIKGRQLVSWVLRYNAASQAEGIYLIRLTIGSWEKSFKTLVLKEPQMPKEEGPNPYKEMFAHLPKRERIIEIAPNPFDSLRQMTFNTKDTLYTIYMFSFRGDTVWQWSPSPEERYYQWQIRAPFYRREPGVYFLKVDGATEVEKRKILIMPGEREGYEAAIRRAMQPQLDVIEMEIPF